MLDCHPSPGAAIAHARLLGIVPVVVAVPAITRDTGLLSGWVLAPPERLGNALRGRPVCAAALLRFAHGAQEGHVLRIRMGLGHRECHAASECAWLFGDKVNATPPLWLPPRPDTRPAAA